MRIASIELWDTYGTVHFKAGPFTALRIHGANGSGKSSILKAISYLFAGGTDPSVIRKPSMVPLATESFGIPVEKSIIELTLDDGTTIRKTTRPKKGGGFTTDLEVTQPDGSPRPAPQTFINELASAMAVDPSALLRIDATTAPGRKALAAELMKLVPIQFTNEDILEAIPTCPLDIPFPPKGYYALDDLKQFHVNVSEQRRRLGIQRDDADGASNELRKALPPEDGTDSSVALKAAEDYRRTVEKAKNDARTDIANLRDNIINEARRVFEQAKDMAVKQFDESWASIDAESEPVLAKAIADVTTAQEHVKNETRAQVIRQQIAASDKKFKAAALQYEQLSGVLQRLDELRLRKLQNLPVAGLVVEEGQASIDGIPWENVNTERRVEVVLQICSLNSGKLPLILWDDAEHASTENRTAIEQGLIQAGYQLLEACVSDEDGLKIEVIE